VTPSRERGNVVVVSRRRRGATRSPCGSRQLVREVVDALEPCAARGSLRF
jgi:hypothetical protein